MLFLSGMPDEGRNTKRLYVTLALATIEHLETLARRGTHGTGVADVAKGLIEDGIRRALLDGFLKLPD
jgi:hypothetical protein